MLIVQHNLIRKFLEFYTMANAVDLLEVAWKLCYFLILSGLPPRKTYCWKQTNVKFIILILCYIGLQNIFILDCSFKWISVSIQEIVGIATISANSQMLCIVKTFCY